MTYSVLLDSNVLKMTVPTSDTHYWYTFVAYQFDLIVDKNEVVGSDTKISFKIPTKPGWHDLHGILEYPKVIHDKLKKIGFVPISA